MFSKNRLDDGGAVYVKVLYIGGTGEISTSCVSASIACGHEVTVFNRSSSDERLPAEVAHVLSFQV